MRTPTSILILALLWGCEQDVIDKGRRDTGVVPDSGLVGALPLRAGMTFTYAATLTYRSDAVAEETSLYTLTVHIASVDDQGPGASSLTFTATGAQTLDDDWQATSDFDLWTSRLGPSLGTDRLSLSAVEDPLSDPPLIPPFPMPPKALPQPGTFFFDVRAIDAIGAAFVEAHQGQQPQLVNPETAAAGTWAFSYDGPDPTTIYYLANKNRSVRLEYHRDGWLVRLDETVGNSSVPPASHATLILMSGP